MTSTLLREFANQLQDLRRGVGSRDQDSFSRLPTPDSQLPIPKTLDFSFKCVSHELEFAIAHPEERFITTRVSWQQ